MEKKSFWSKPEGKTGFLFLAGIIAGGGWLLYNMLPTIITLFQNTLYATFLGLGIFVVAYVLMDPKFRATIWYLYKMAMRAFTGTIIQMNPIAILKSYIDDLGEKKKKMEVQLTELKNQLGVMKRKVADKKDKLEEQANLAKAAQSKGKEREMEMNLYLAQVERLRKNIASNQNLVNRMDVLYGVLERMHYYSGIMILNTKNEVEMREDEYETIRKSHSVMRSAMSIINGGSDKKLIFDEAMQFVVEDIGGKIGEMDRMLDQSAQFINTVDLEDDVYATQGLKFLEELEQKGIDNIFGDSKNKKSLNQGSTNPTIDFTVNTPTPVSSDKNNGEIKHKNFFN